LKFLLVGSGGREHALAWALSKSPIVDKLYCAPGNAGIAEVAERVLIGALEFDRLIDFASGEKIDFVVIGPEAPLIGGLWDRLEAAGIRALGPGAAGAILEGSKGFVKDLCAANNIPTAAYKRCSDAEAAKRFAAGLGLPVVVKADGIAAGKGVVVAETAAERDRAIDLILGKGGEGLVVEEYLEGEEATFFVLTDGVHVLPLIGAQDHKRAFDGDKGPNTGGMGAYSPAPVLAPAIIEKTLDKIIIPTLAAMAARGTPYMGVLYAGLMIYDDEPKLIEYNCRFGDPECQVLMMRLKSDLAIALLAARDGQLKHLDLRWSDEAALTVVMAAEGYPGHYAKGSEIRNVEAAAQVKGVQIFHAATERHNQKLMSSGGRVLNVTASGRTIAEAQERAYRAVDLIDWPDGFCRHDIGWRALRR